MKPSKFGVGQPLRRVEDQRLVTGGGRPAEGQWKAVRHGFLLPVRVVMAVFRGKLLAALRQALARAELGLPEGMQPHQLLNLLHRLGHPRKTNWNVHIRERYRHGAGVVTFWRATCVAVPSKMPGWWPGTGSV